MCPAIVNPAFGGNQDKWNEVGYATLSVASRVSNSLKTHTATLSLARDLWKLNTLLRNILEIVYNAVEHPTPPKEPVTQEQILAAAEVFRKVHGVVDNIYTLAKSKGLTNRRLLGTIFNSVKQRSEEVLDIGDWMVNYTDPEADKILNQAIDDLHRGHVHDLSEVFK